MHRPTVLHLVEHWVRPSEGFVYDTVRTTTATRAVVAAGHRIPGSAAAAWPGRVVDLSRCRDAPPADAAGGDDSSGRRNGWSRNLTVRHAVAALAVLERADVIHAHFGQSGQAAWRAGRRIGRPVVVALHGWDLLVGARRDPGILEAARNAQLVVVPSQFLADAATAAGVPASIVRVVPSGLDLSTLRHRERGRPAGPPIVTFAGRFAAKKGVLDAARAIGAVATEIPLRARFVGHGPLEPELRELLAELRFDAEIVDGRPPGAVRAALAETDVALTASRTAEDGDAETLGLVNLEALASGVPLVTVAHGGVAEAVPRQAAILVPESPVEAIVDALAGGLRELLSTPQRWAEMGRAGREHVAAHYELGARTADLEELWCALASGARGEDLPRRRAIRSPARVSVVMVTHNRAPLLERTLTALAAQTRPADEVIVVDNGSSDGTGELLERRLGADSPRGLRVIERHGNPPVAESRNVAVAASSGDVVAFTDDDCRPRPTWLESLISGFAEGIGIVQGRTTADPTQPLVPLSRTQWTPAEFGLYETCNVAYLRDSLDRAAPPAPVGPFDLGFADDVARALGPRWGHLPFGEDTELGWRVKRIPVASRFAAHAVVDHEVFAPDPALVLKRAALVEAFPVLVARVPELRRTFLWGGVFLGRRRVRQYLAVVGGCVGLLSRSPRRRAVGAVAVLPYVAELLDVRSLRRPGSRRAQVRAVPIRVRRDFTETVALLRGSIRARAPVL